MRAMRNDPELATLMWECRRHSLFRVQGCKPTEALLAASQRLHLDWFGNTLVEIKCHTVDLFKCDVQHFAHELGEQAKNMSWSQTRSDVHTYTGRTLDFQKELTEKLRWPYTMS